MTVADLIEDPPSAEVPPPAAAPAPEPAVAVVPPVETPPAEPPVDLVALARAAVDRVTALPRGVRTEIERLLSAERLMVDLEGRPCLPLEDALAAFAASLPAQWSLDPTTLPAANHPGGEAFFTGDPSALTDERAEAIAKAQLARAGWGSAPAA